MPDKDVMTTIAAVAGILASILVIINGTLTLLHERSKASGTAEPLRLVRIQQRLALNLARIKQRATSADALPFLPYLLREEISVIVPAGLLLNFIGAAMATELGSLMYLDMGGTAFVSFLLGPWWGATTGLLSNSVVNWILSDPKINPDTDIFPYSLVNITGGIFWGYMAQRMAFRKYLISSSKSWSADVMYLITFGGLAAGVMSVVGAMVDDAVVDVASPDKPVQFLSGLTRVLSPYLHTILDDIFGAQPANVLSTFIPRWLETWLRYIPDKTISAVFALAALRSSFPMFENQLIQRSECAALDNWSGPTILGSIYIYSFVRLLQQAIPQAGKTVPGTTFGWLWCLPLIAVFVGLWSLRRKSTDLQARKQRFERYTKAEILFGGWNESFARFKLTTIIVSGIWLACNGLVVLAQANGVLALAGGRINLVQITFFTLCIVYGSFMTIDLIRISVSQNISMATQLQAQRATGISDKSQSSESSLRVDHLPDVDTRMPQGATLN